MSVKMRQMVEREIVEAVIDDLLAAGFYLEIDNGDDTDDPEVSLTRNRDALVAGIMATDQEHIFASDSGAMPEKGYKHWVFLVYGNGGWDVINDYTINLENVLVRAKEATNKYSDEGSGWK